MPWLVVNSAVGKDLAVFLEFEFSANKPVCELAWFDGERADVASNLVAVFFDAATENYFEYAVPLLAFRTEDQPDKVRRDGDRNRRRRGL